jgi:threonine dehydrogenase-like Zn-dependent dehydrogenase
MKALVWTDIRKIEIKEVPKPEVKSDEVLLEVKKAGICGSEISAFLGQNELRKPPLIMGHEFSGVVVEVGSTAPKDLEDKLVAVNPLLSCGKCEYCRKGLRQLCLKREFVGVDKPGGFAQYVCVPFESCYEVNSEIGGALVEPLATSIRAIKKAQISLQDNAVVIGAGSIGLLTAWCAQKSGVSELLILDTNDKRLELAKRVLNCITANPLLSDSENILSQAFYGEKADVVIDAVGSNQTRELSLKLIKRGGRVVLIGLHENATSIPGNKIVRDEIEIVGSFAYTDENFKQAVKLINQHSELISKEWYQLRRFTEAQEAFIELTTPKSPYIKTILSF